MIRYSSNILLIIAVCFFMLAITGCKEQKNVIVNTDQLGEMMDKSDYSTRSGSHQVIRLKNGVVIYKDTSTARSPSGYSDVNFSPSKSIHFGPSEVKFSPDKVNPK